jgi:hypothetical protein
VPRRRSIDVDVVDFGDGESTVDRPNRRFDEEQRYEDGVLLPIFLIVSII